MNKPTFDSERIINRRTYIQRLSPYDFEGPLDKIIEWLIGLKEDYNKYKDLGIEVDSSHDGTDIELFGTLTESQEDFEARALKYEEDLKAWNEWQESNKALLLESEKRLYERLKKKYES